MQNNQLIRTGASALSVALCCLLPAAPAPAQEAKGAWPAKPLRLILPFAGGTDLIGRTVSQQMASGLNQQIVPDPRYGAAGNIGYLAAAKSPPDGYTLLLGSVPMFTNPHLNPKVGYDTLRDFAPIAVLASIPNVLVVHPSVPAKSMRELIALARTGAGRIAYGSGGFGSANHLAAELMQLESKVKFTHVPYKSAAFGLVGAMSGEVDMVITAVSSAVPYVEGGRMRPLVVLDTKRLGAMPRVPTSAEAGVPGILAVNWYSLLVPVGAPRAVIDRLHAEASKAVAMPDIRNRLASLGAETDQATPEQTGERMRAEYARWGRVIREAGIRAE